MSQIYWHGVYKPEIEIVRFQTDHMVKYRLYKFGRVPRHQINLIIAIFFVKRVEDLKSIVWQRISYGNSDTISEPKASTATRFSRTSTKQDSLYIVLRTVEEHIVDSSREFSIVLPLRLKRQWQKRNSHRRQFRLSWFISMVTPHFGGFLHSDSVLTQYL